MVELWFCKPGVVGSNPTVGFFNFGASRQEYKRPAYKKPAFFHPCKTPTILKTIIYTQRKPGFVFIRIDSLIHCYLVINSRSKSDIVVQLKIC